MAKITLEFDLLEEKSEYEMALHGGDYYCALHDIERWLRDLLKYNDTLPKTTRDAYQLVRDRIHTELADRDVKLF